MPLTARAGDTPTTVAHNRANEIVDFIPCTYRIALGPRAGQKVLSLQTVPSQAAPPTEQRCVNEQGFSLHAKVHCAAHQRQKLESQGQGWALLGAPRTQHLCRSITRPALADD